MAQTNKLRCESFCVRVTVLINKTFHSMIKLISLLTRKIPDYIAKTLS